ncbi:MAG: prepilin-type N-terminal cleavage/methylation domain-containing protein [Candidatus Microsaccharimonas sp.]
MYRSKQGFTIVELLIVVVIIAILAGITIVAYNGITRSANNSNIQNILSQSIRKIEMYKTDSSTAQYPLTLSAAGLNLVNTSDTIYVYAVSSDGKQFCLANSRSGRTYYITNSSPKPKAGICSFTTGTAGTGDVATDGPSVARYSLFGSTTPGTTQAVWNDGGGSLRIGNRFYTTETGGIKVTGIRLYNPADASGTFLNLGLTAYAYLNDWAGSGINSAGTFSTSPVATKAYSTTRVAGTWTDILFDSPVTLPAITPGAGINDLLTLAIQFTGGTYYVYVTPSFGGGTAVESVVKTKTFLAENTNLGRGINTDDMSGILNSYYGIDILYEMP